jgi:uncharacterized protein YjbI with pentapeptide repeats
MNEERVQILKMLQEGRITVDEAARLIDALSSESEPPVAPTRGVAIPVEVFAANEDKQAETENREPFRYTFMGCNLENARFDGAHTEDSKIWFSNLENANLQNAHLQNAWVIGANLEHANLAGAHLEGAKIAGCNLDHANLSGADLRGAVLIGVNLEHAQMRGENLRGRILIGVNLAGRREQPQFSVSVTKE